jgi:omega-6 fatty acid desaturase (delta-12 desaturase)
MRRFFRIETCCSIVPPIRRIQDEKRAIIHRYAQASDSRALTQVLMALGILAFFWWAATLTVPISFWLAAPLVLMLSLFNLRIFVLMHKCGHGSLFRTRSLNRAFGFLLVVVSGMPQ